MTATDPKAKVIDRSECGLPEALLERDWPRSLSPTSVDEPPGVGNDVTTIAILPDTQYYASCREMHFPDQVKWLSTQIEARNILAAIQLGDLTEHNSAAEWSYLVDAVAPLRDKVPLLFATGNHDYGTGGVADYRVTQFQKYLGKPSAPTLAVMAESMTPADPENAYFRLKTSFGYLGVLILEWSPRTNTVAWAKTVFAKYPKDRTIFVTHAYLYHDGTRYDFAKYGSKQEWNPREYGTARKDPEKPLADDNWADHGAYDGQMLWDELLKDQPGLFLTLNGHVLADGADTLTSVGTHGNQVHQVLANYQMLDEGGLGYLRLLELAGDGSRFVMKTYSPSLKRFATADNQSFEREIHPPLK